MTDAAAVLRDAHGPVPRRRRWPWLVAAGVVVVLLIAAAVVAELLARHVVTTAVRQLVVSQLGVDDPDGVDVGIPGPILPQVVVGSIGDLTVTVPDASMGGLRADVIVQLRDVPLDGAAEMSGGTAVVTIDAEDVSRLVVDSSGGAVTSVAIAAPDVVASSSLTVLGATIPVAVTLAPSAAGGALVLTPVSIDVAGASLDLQAARARLGGLSDAVLGERSVCFADRLPAGLTLTDVSIEDAAVAASFDVAPGILADPALRETGSCG